MYRHDARLMLGLPPTYTRADVETAFRGLARVTHPDAGGDPGDFAALVESREVLLRTLALHDRVVMVRDAPWHRLLGRVRKPRGDRVRRVI